MDREQKHYIHNIEYLNVAQLKSLHKIEITRLRDMIARYDKVLPSKRGKIDVRQLSAAIDEQKALLDELCKYIDKLENLEGLKEIATTRK